MRFNSGGHNKHAGFGLYGHAENLAKAQKKPVKFLIDCLPLINRAARIDSALGDCFKLLQGKSAETSGFFHPFSFSYNILV